MIKSIADGSSQYNGSRDQQKMVCTENAVEGAGGAPTNQPIVNGGFEGSSSDSRSSVVR